MSGSGTSNNIVQVVVNVQEAAAPSIFQNTGAFISLGATTLTTGTYSLLTQESSLAAILATGTPGNSVELQAMNLEFYAQGSGAVYVLELGTAGTPASLGTFLAGAPFFIYAFRTPAAWDTSAGKEVASVTVTAGGTGYTAATVTFSAPGTGGTLATGTAILNGGVITGVTITNPGVYPSSSPTVTFSGAGTGATGTVNTAGIWVSFLNQYTSTTAKEYFFFNTSSGSYAQYAASTTPLKCAMAFIPAPTAPTTEDDAGTAFYKFINYNPSAVNLMTPMAFSYVYDVTAYPLIGNATLLATYKAANINYITTGAEGGITNTIIKWGAMLDGNDASVWWEVDWIDIQTHQAIANVIINGSNNPQAPVVYNQAGIDAILAAIQRVVTNGINWGVINPNQPVTLTATPFTTYVTANPGNYQDGIYNGFALTCTPQRGFLSVTFYITVVF